MNRKIDGVLIAFWVNMSIGCLLVGLSFYPNWAWEIRNWLAMSGVLLVGAFGALLVWKAGRT